VHEVKENTLVTELLHIVTCDCLLFISQSLKHSRLHFSPLTTPCDVYEELKERAKEVGLNIRVKRKINGTK